MGNYTENLDLFVTDMDTDGNDYFNFDRDLNDNFEKIDAFAGDTIENLTAVGSYIWFDGENPPPNYLVCNGGAVSRTSYSKLFAVIGTRHGAGDGSTTFNLPNLTDGRYIKGGSAAQVGTTSQGQVGYHTHTMESSGSHEHNSLSGTASGSNIGARATNFTVATDNTTIYGVGAGSHSHSVSGSAGSGSSEHTHTINAHGSVGQTNEPKSLVALPCIKYQ